MARQRDKGYPRQEEDFYPTEAWATKGMLEKLRRAGIVLPNVIWEPCCGDGAISKELEVQGYRVFSTDLVYRGYGEGGRDFMLEDRLPDGLPVGKVAIVTNPPYGLYGKKGTLRLLVAHAMDLLRPVGGMLVLLVNVQWSAQKKNSVLCCDPAYAAMVTLTDRLVQFRGSDGKPLKQPQENHVWLVWDFSPERGPFQALFAGKNPESEQRSCTGCGTPLPPGSRADMRYCSDACRQRARRSGMAQHRDADSTAVMESGKVTVAGSPRARARQDIVSIDTFS